MHVKTFRYNAITVNTKYAAFLTNQMWLRFIIRGEHCVSIAFRAREDVILFTARVISPFFFFLFRLSEFLDWKKNRHSLLSRLNDTM